MCVADADGIADSGGPEEGDEDTEADAGADEECMNDLHLEVEVAATSWGA